MFDQVKKLPGMDEGKANGSCCGARPVSSRGCCGVRPADSQQQEKTGQKSGTGNCDCGK